MTTFRIVPISKLRARQFVAEHHRHNEAPSVAQVSFVVGLEIDGELVGVATAGHPVARLLDDGFTLEVSRVCVNGEHKNANTALYGAIRRAAKALGYRRLVTYTLVSEGGASLRGAGFSAPEPIRNRSWQGGSKVRVRHDVTLWGDRKMTVGQDKYRWEMAL